MSRVTSKMSEKVKNKSVAATALLCQCFASPVITMSNIQQSNISTMSDHAPLSADMKVGGTIWSNIQIEKEKSSEIVDTVYEDYI